MKTMALKASRKVSYDALWEFFAFCQKLKNEGKGFIYTEGPYFETFLAAQTEAHKFLNRFPTTKTAYLEFLIELLRARVPLYTPEQVRAVSSQYRQSVHFMTHQGMIKHYTVWKNMPTTDVAWDYFFRFVTVDSVSKGSNVEFYKSAIYKLEQTAADWQFDLTEMNYHVGLHELWKQQKFNRPESYEKLITDFKIDDLNKGNTLPNKDFFQEICSLMSLKSTFIMGLTKATFIGLHDLFNRFWAREMPLYFEKTGKKMPENLAKVHKPQMARFFELWLKSKYPVLFERAMKSKTQVPDFKGKWSFRQVIQYLPPCALSEWGKYPLDSWQFAFLAHLGGGGSARTFLLPPQYRLSKRAAHIFSTATKGANLGDMLRNAMYSALGASSSLQSELEQHLLNAHASFFEDCVRFFVREGKTLTYQQYVILFNYINHIVEETGQFDFKGRTIVSLNRAYDEWQKEVTLMRLKAHKDQVWPGAKMKDMVFKNAKGKALYHFIQLKNAYDLALEGSMMHHCVGGYSWQCIEGSTSIWSLRRLEKTGDVSLVTVQVMKKRIVQARGAFNGLPKEEELSFIKKWANTEGVCFDENRNGYW
jgi:hypothetical protein